MFGGFQNGWSAGLNQFTDLSERVQKLKTGLEAGLQDSGLLGPGDAPENEQDAKQRTNNLGLQPQGASPAGKEQKEEQSLGRKSIAVESSLTLSKEEEAWNNSSGWNEEVLKTLPATLDEPAQTDAPDGTHGDGLEKCQRLQLEPATHSNDSSSHEEGEPPQIAEQAELSPAVGSHSDHDSIDREGSQERESSSEQPFNESADAEALAELLSNSPASTDDLKNSPLHPEAEPISEHEEMASHHGLTNGGRATDEAAAIPPTSDTAAESQDQMTMPESSNGAHDDSAILPNGKQESGRSKAEIQGMPLEELQSWALQMQAALQAREVQLERKFEEVAHMQEVTNQLMARNEELARKSAKASEEDIRQLTEEYEVRLGTAERKVYALSKERDMLKRGSEKLSSANDLLKEKDNIIAQVMAEGEQLSKRQLQQENTMKKLRQQLKETEMSRKELASDAAVERRRLEEALTAKQKAEADLVAARQAHTAELAAEKSHYESLLAKARAAQVEAENKAAQSAKEGLSRKLKEAEMRSELLADQVADLQMGMERQRSAADAREDMLKRELAGLERRNQEAEARHEELTNKLPDATRPLLRQIEGMQRTATAHSQAWQAAEQALQSRLADAEARAAAAAEKERLASERLQAANTKASSLGAALDALREDSAEAHAKLDDQEEELRATRLRCSKLEEQCNQLLSKLDALEAERSELEQSMELRVAEAKQASRQMLAAAESRAALLEEQLRSHSPEGVSSFKGAGVGEPPIMPGPGHKWVLVREDEDAQSLSQQRAGEGALNSSGSFRGALARATAPELERMRDAMQQREEQLAACQDNISKLEATRDSLAEELVALSQTSEQHAGAWRDLERLQLEHKETLQKLVACTELLGEREERILELSADIVDMKALYRDQIEYVLDMTVSSSHSRAASSVSSWVPAPERKE